jgi:hypothetical protein
MTASTTAGGGGGASRAARKAKGGAKMLGDAHEATEQFASEMGRAYIGDRIRMAEDTQMLRGGQGAAFSVAPASGVLAPWGVMRVVVTAFNNMPGGYADELECAVAGIPTTKIPMKVGVRGCPLTLKPECVGLDLTGIQAAPPRAPRLRFGQVAIGQGEIERRIIVKNAGPIDALVAWRLGPDDGSDDAEKEPRIVNVNLTRNPDLAAARERPIALSIKWIEKPPYHPPFEVRPTSRRVKAHSEAAFHVRMPRETAHADSQHLVDAKEDKAGAVRALMVADAQWIHPNPYSDGDDGEGGGGGGGEGRRSRASRDGATPGADEGSPDLSQLKSPLSKARIILCCVVWLGLVSVRTRRSRRRKWSSPKRGTKGSGGGRITTP